MDKIKTNVYTFKDILKKREYLLKRFIEIYPTSSTKELEKILDSIKIKFRDQEERGASNHKNKMIFLPLHDFDKYSLKTKNDVILYLESPKSSVTHETVHIFQNCSDSFPDIKYLEKKLDGKYNIDYDKYWNDSGEKQSRLEQVRELLDWGLTKQEIIHFLYNRKHDDRKLWSRIIEHAIKLKEQIN